MKLDRKFVSFSKEKILQDEDINYWKKATIEEKLRMITYLRECFYGIEATTGRLFEFSEKSQS